MPIAASIGPRSTVRAKPSSVQATSATIAGWMPRRRASPVGVAPHVTYAHANTSTIRAAGRMNAAPATISPAMPARRRPRSMTSSVEFGPGIRLVSPT